MAQISDALRNAHPDSPWLWREDWASGRIRSAHGTIAAVACVLAMIFSGFSIPLAFRAAELVETEGIGIALLAGVFPLASLGLCYWAITSTARWLRFRNTQLSLDTLPGVVGGRFAATVHVGSVVEPGAGFKARLCCVKRARRGKKAEETTVWQHDLQVAAARTRRGAFGTAVPVAFDIPYESEPTTMNPGRPPGVKWRLEVRAELPGADFHSVFEVPVFKTEHSSPDVSERIEPGQPADDQHFSGAAATETLDDTRIGVARANDGSLEILLPASRNRAGALFLTLFAGAWNGFLFYVGREPPGLFLLALAPFAFVGLLLAFFVPVAWLQSTTLQARPGALTIRQRMLGKGSARVLALDEIEAIVPEAKGSNGGNASWAVRIQLKSGRKPRTAATNIASKADAQRIATLLSQALGQGR